MCLKLVFLCDDFVSASDFYVNFSGGGVSKSGRSILKSYKTSHTVTLKGLALDMNTPGDCSDGYFAVDCMLVFTAQL